MYAVIPTDGEPRVVTIARDLTMPSGLAFADGDLYVGALNEIWRFPDIATTRESKPTPELITDALPTERHHGWKYLDFGPDGDLFVPVGAPCNICLSKDERFASILRMDPRTGIPRSSRTAYGTVSASTGTPKRASCGSPTTAAT